MPIIKHNKLIDASYKLSSREQFFVLYLISQISQGESRLKEYKMHYSEIERIINFDGKRRIANKREVFNLMDKLNSEPIIYERGSVIGKSVWLQHMEHDTETDMFTFSLSQKLREYLLQLKEHFTRYNISNIVYLNANAVRLYEVLKRFQYLGECELTVEKIKFYLGIEDRYSKFYEFKRWVLLPSQSEIEKYTDIRFDFVPAKKERKRIISLRFHIYENQPTYSPDTIQLLQKLDGQISDNASISISGSSKGADRLRHLTQTQLAALHYLKNKGVNQSIILDQILDHPKVKYLPLQAYEDIYVKAIWKFFSDKTTSDKDKRAGAFVSWWKKGRLTEDGLHAHMLELVIRRKKAMSEDERSRRELIREGVMSPEIPFPKLKQEKQQPRKKQSKNTWGRFRAFDIEDFKASHPAQYQSVLQRIKAEYERTFEQVGETFQPDKYRKAIEDKVYYECQAWLSAQSSAGQS
ncbi:MAG: replication initiation protein [Bacteroidota bacterium]